jgi:hypothetical protein
MAWREELLDHLAAAMPCGYEQGAAPATEPVALACLALSVHGRREESLRALEWLRSVQNDDGSLGPMAGIDTPGWPTALAILAHGYAGGDGCADVLGFCGGTDWSPRSRIGFPEGGIGFSGGASPRVRVGFSGDDRKRAVDWLLASKGGVLARQPYMGHDPTLVGWPWVLGTHSWVEPTALAVLALKAAGEGNHPRAQEAVRLLCDRLLPDGGCNYGNTIVLGQTLRPHIQPTALTLLALFGERDNDGRIAKSVDWLCTAVDAQTAAASMAYGVWALAHYGRFPANANQWLAGAASRHTTRSSPHRMALVLLASAAFEARERRTE